MPEYIPARAQSLTDRKLIAAAGLDARFSDFNPGSVIRTIFEADSLIEEELELRMYRGLVAGIAEELYSTFDFAPLPAIPAAGLVSFLRGNSTGSVTIPADTVVAAPATTLRPEISFRTQDEATLDAGQGSVDVPVIADLGGTVGNVPQGAISLLRTLVSGIGGVTNPAAFLAGIDSENDQTRRARFALWVSNLRGATAAGLEANALSVVRVDGAGNAIERVDRALAVDSTVSGRVDVYVDNGGGDASDELIALTQAKLDGGYTEAGDRIIGYKAAGIVVRVFGTKGVAASVTTTILLEPGYEFATVQAAVTEAVTVFIHGLGVFRPLILADLINVIAEVPGVRDLVLAAPSANASPQFNERLLPGPITVYQYQGPTAQWRGLRVIADLGYGVVPLP